MVYSRNSQDLHIVPALAPVDIAAATTVSDIIDAGDCTRVQFLMYFGQLDVNGVVNVYNCSNAAGAGAAAITAFTYRWSAVTGTDLMGAVTAGALNVAVTNGTHDTCVLVIDIEPANLTAGLPYCYVEYNPTLGAANLLAIIALVTPRYSQAVVPSVVD
jgi:hypothetical protein